MTDRLVPLGLQIELEFRRGGKEKEKLEYAKKSLKSWLPQTSVFKIP